MKDIILKAIEGGWNPWKTIMIPGDFLIERIDYQRWSLIHPNGADNIGTFYESRMILDPLFWQALGKTCRWGEWSSKKRKHSYIPDWKAHAMAFHEMNLSDGWDAAVAWLGGIVSGNE